MKEVGKTRLHPPVWHSRYVHLKLMKSNIKSLIERHIAEKSKASLVDMGCGDMPYYDLINPHVENYIGVDVEGKRKAQYFVDVDTNKVNIATNYADLIWSIQVLELVENPEKYLAECNRILKPREKLLLSTHGHWFYHPDPVDNWRWTCTGLIKQIERAGFKVKEVKGMMDLLSMSLQLFQDACLLHFPFVKYWKTPFCFVMQRVIALGEIYTSLSKTTRSYVNKDACVFL